MGTYRSFAEVFVRVIAAGLALSILVVAASVHGQAPGELNGIGPVDTYRYFDHPIDERTYLIRPGDELEVIFVKAKLPSLKLPVNAEGKIVHATLGVFDLSHKTLYQAKELLREAVLDLFNVDEIAISVTDPQKVGIPVSGAVTSPGLYTSYTSQRVSEIIDSAGGVLATGSRRGIILSGGPQEILVDLDKADFLGDNDANPCLYAGFNVHVPSKSSLTVQVVGEVNHPREIELLPGDDLKVLLQLAGGMRTQADLASVRIISGSTLRSGQDGEIQAGDIIWVPTQSADQEVGRLTVFGAVTQPGKYEYHENITLNQIVRQAGGFSHNANASRTTVFRQTEADEWGRSLKLRYPITNVVNEAGEIEPLSLLPADSVFVPVRVGYVEVSGEVSHPGLFPCQETRSALSYINAAGGFLPTADRSQVRLFNRVSRTTSSHSPEVLVNDGDEIIVKLREELQ